MPDLEVRSMVGRFRPPHVPTLLGVHVLVPVVAREQGCNVCSFEQSFQPVEASHHGPAVQIFHADGKLRRVQAPLLLGLHMDLHCATNCR
ncbi:hypothetical protein Mapa_005288 [Marchantia paleacea]|nr:hypothetical protein Mapa_005288 [Marchantia paleacea]